LDFTSGLIIVISLVHVFAAVIWIGGNFFELMTLVPALRRNSRAVQDEVATTVPLQEHKNSAVAATITIIAGPILAYLYSRGDMSIFTSTPWGLAILSGGTIAIILYFVGWYAGSLRVKIAALTKARIAISKSNSGVSKKGQPLDEGGRHVATASLEESSSSSEEELLSASARLSKMIYVENLLGAVVLALMIIAATI
jgi:uncharacterized membrane protein